MCFAITRASSRDVGLVVTRWRAHGRGAHGNSLFFQRAQLGRMPSLPKEIQRLSLKQMAEFMLDDARQAEAGNVEPRIWAPNRPVIHFAAAAPIVGLQLRKSGHPLALETLLFHRWAVEAIATLAEELATLIANDQKFPVSPAQLIRFRLD